MSARLQTMAPVRVGSLGTIFLAVGALGALVPGCASSQAVPAGVGPVDAIEIPMLPVPVDWDATPGPDGLRVQVFFFRVEPNTGQVKTATVRGTLEFLLFEGRLGAAELAEAEPAYAWRFSGDELRPYATRGAAGWGYALQLAWGQRPPCRGACTLVARYDSGDGGWRYSKPNSSLVIPSSAPAATSPSRTSLP